MTSGIARVATTTREPVLQHRIDRGEAIEIRSADGAVEIRITVGEHGPVVQVRGVRVELETPDTLALRCRRLEVDAEDGIRLESGGGVHVAAQEMRVATDGDIHLNGDVIRLNC